MAMIVDIMTRPKHGMDDEEKDVTEDEPAPSAARDPEALISSIEAQLAQLRSALAVLED